MTRVELQNVGSRRAKHRLLWHPYLTGVGGTIDLLWTYHDVLAEEGKPE